VWLAALWQSVSVVVSQQNTWPVLLLFREISQKKTSGVTPPTEACFFWVFFFFWLVKKQRKTKESLEVATKSLGTFDRLEQRLEVADSKATTERKSQRTKTAGRKNWSGTTAHGHTSHSQTPHTRRTGTNTRRETYLFPA
jgi:hypothetical protein